MRVAAAVAGRVVRCALLASLVGIIEAPEAAAQPPPRGGGGERVPDGDEPSPTRRYADALDALHALDRAAAERELDALLEAIEQTDPAGTPDFDLRARAYYHRARVRVARGDRVGASDDLRRLAQTDPDFALDPELVSPALLRLRDEVWDELNGRLALEVSPADARAWIDGFSVDPRRVVPAAAGARTVRVSRRGFETQEHLVPIDPADTTVLRVDLTAVSTTLRIVRTAVVLAAPRPDARPVGTAAPGEMLELLDDDGGWLRVRPAIAGGVGSWDDGWVSASVAAVLD